MSNVSSWQPTGDIGKAIATLTIEMDIGEADAILAELGALLHDRAGVRSYDLRAESAAPAWYRANERGEGERE